MSDVDTSVEKGVCYTLEVALEKSIVMEERAFRNFLQAIRLIEDRQAKAILRDAAKEELEHKHRLEMVLLEGHEQDASDLKKELPVMNLNYVYEQTSVSADSSARESLAYAINLEKKEIDFYRALMHGCEGAPMAELFNGLLADETRHLQILEDLYEKHFLPEN